MIQFLFHSERKQTTEGILIKVLIIIANNYSTCSKELHSRSMPKTGILCQNETLAGIGQSQTPSEDKARKSMSKNPPTNLNLYDL